MSGLVVGTSGGGQYGMVTQTAEAIAVTVIGGYLGAGKTTLVNHILATADERVAVLVNDFGDVNIDASLIESADGDTISLANGCICCSLVDGFSAALTTIRELDPLPRRLVIETSGVADPATVAAYGHGPGLALDAVVVVVDAETVEQRSGDKYVGDTVLIQLRSADILVLNKVDLVGPERAASTREWLGRQAPNAVVVETNHSAVGPEVLFGLFPDRPDAALAHSHDSPANADQLFDSCTWASDEPVARAAVEKLMSALPDSVVRAKGLIKILEEPDHAMVLQRVGRRWTLRKASATTGAETTTPPPSSQLVFIGMHGTLDEAWIDQHLTTES